MSPEDTTSGMKERNWDTTAIALALESPRSPIYHPRFEWGESLQVGYLEFPTDLELYAQHRAIRIRTVDMELEFHRLNDPEISEHDVGFFGNRNGFTYGVRISTEGSLLGFVMEPKGARYTASGLQRVEQLQ